MCSLRSLLFAAFALALTVLAPPRAVARSHDAGTSDDPSVGIDMALVAPASAAAEPIEAEPEGAYVYAGRCDSAGKLDSPTFREPLSCTGAGVDRVTVVRGVKLHSTPRRDAPEVGRLAAGARVTVLAVVKTSRFNGSEPDYAWARVRAE